MAVEQVLKWNLKCCHVLARYALKADIWSFGMTLLEVAQGHAPFASLPFEVLVLSAVNGPTPGLEEDPDCPEHRFSKVNSSTYATCCAISILHHALGMQLARKTLCGKAFHPNACILEVP